MSIGRSIRFNSTKCASSVEGSAVTITLTATIRLRKVKLEPLPEGSTDPPTITDLETPRDETLTLTVTPKVANALLVNATDSDGSGGSGTGAPYNLPAEYHWGVVSGEMATAGSGGLSGLSGIAGTLHTKSELITTPKLFSSATYWFNSSHGTTTGVSANAAGQTLEEVSWSSIKTALTSGVTSNISPTRPLQLNMAFLYSCWCNDSPGLSFNLFGSANTNQAALGFTTTVFTTLVPGVTTEVRYNDVSGTVTMLNEKLTAHVTDLISNLIDGLAADDARKEANRNYPPRTFSQLDPNDARINLMKVTNMMVKGDLNARLGSVYRPEDPATFVSYSDQVLVFK